METQQEQRELDFYVIHLYSSDSRGRANKWDWSGPFCSRESAETFALQLKSPCPLKIVTDKDKWAAENT